MSETGAALGEPTALHLRDYGRVLSERRNETDTGSADAPKRGRKPTRRTS